MTRVTWLIQSSVSCKLVSESLAGKSLMAWVLPDCSCAAIIVHKSALTLSPPQNSSGSLEGDGISGTIISHYGISMQFGSCRNYPGTEEMKSLNYCLKTDHSGKIKQLPKYKPPAHIPSVIEMVDQQLAFSSVPSYLITQHPVTK